MTFPSLLIAASLLNRFNYLAARGVQYVHVHCVTHKSFMVKVGRKRKTNNVCKKSVKLTKSGGKFAKVGGKEKISVTGGMN